MIKKYFFISLFLAVGILAGAKTNGSEAGLGQGISRSKLADLGENELVEKFHESNMENPRDFLEAQTDFSSYDNWLNIDERAFRYFGHTNTKKYKKLDEYQLNEEKEISRNEKELKAILNLGDEDLDLVRDVISKARSLHSIEKSYEKKGIVLAMARQPGNPNHIDLKETLPIFEKMKGTYLRVALAYRKAVTTYRAKLGAKDEKIRQRIGKLAQ